jgi:hypothetical protein
MLPTAGIPAPASIRWDHDPPPARPASALAVVALGAAWWLLSDPLSAEEQRFVGTWRRSVDDGAMTCTLGLAADRQWLQRVVVTAGWGGEEGTCWAVRSGELILDAETIRVQSRPLRHLLRLLGRTSPVVRRHAVEIEGDRLVVTESNGSRIVWTRAPAE